MEVIRGSAEHASAVSAFWNEKAQDADSWWFGAPTRTPAEIVDLLSQGLSLVVACDGPQVPARADSRGVDKPVEEIIVPGDGSPWGVPNRALEGT
jgi:hypothetical protein